MKRYIEAAIRLKWRLLICGLLLLGVAWAALYFSRQWVYTSSATVWAEKPIYFPSDPNESRYSGPAENQVSIFNELLRTRQFTLSIAQKANMPLGTPAEEEQAYQTIRQGLDVEAEGNYLVKMTCTASNANYCKDIILQSIELFLNELNTSRARQAEVALQVYDEQRIAYEQAMITSRDLLNKYITDHPDAVLTTGPNPALAELQQQYNADRMRYDEITSKVNEIRVQSEATPDLNNSFFRIADPPGDAEPYRLGLRDMVINSLIAVLVALLGMIALIIVGAWTDHVVYTLNDAKSVLLAENSPALEVLLTVVPRNKWLATLRRRAEKERKASKKTEHKPRARRGGKSSGDPTQAKDHPTPATRYPLPDSVAASVAGSHPVQEGVR